MSATKYDTLMLAGYSGAEWLRSEQHFHAADLIIEMVDAIRALSADLAAAIAQPQPAAMCGCGDTFGEGSVCANCLAGIDCKPVPDEVPSPTPDMVCHGADELIARCNLGFERGDANTAAVACWYAMYATLYGIGEYAIHQPQPTAVPEGLANAVLANIAAIAHCGGLAKLDNENALSNIRQLSKPWCDNTGTLRDLKNRVDAAIISAGGDA